MPDWEQVDKFSNEEKEAYYAFFDSILTLSAGALTLSITLRNQFISENTIYIWLIKCSWLGFVAAIVLTLCVRWGRNSVARKALEEALQPTAQCNVIEMPSGYIWAGRFALISFSIGIGSLTSFAFYNL